MTKKVVALLVVFSLMVGFVACDAVAPSEISSPTEKVTPSLTPTPTPVPDTTPLYKTMNVGSSKKLQGNCVFINIFLSDGESEWTESSKKQVLCSLEASVLYMDRWSQKYNPSFSIIYNTRDTNINYTVDYIIPRNSKADWPYEELLSEIRSQYDIDGIMKKYDADNLSFIIHINKSGRSHAMQHGGNISANDEAAIIYNYNGIPEGISESEVSYGGNVEIAHEIFHLFGAIDLYNLDNEKLALAKEYFPNEIMLEPSVFISECSISELTAYLIGWRNELKEEYRVFLE